MGLILAQHYFCATRKQGSEVLPARRWPVCFALHRITIALQEHTEGIKSNAGAPVAINCVGH